MVRGNWQKRVEQAEERRKENKQKKVNRNSKSVNKSLVQNQLWPYLNRMDHTHIKRNSALHVWVDTPPMSWKKSHNLNDNTNGCCYDDFNEEYHQQDKQKKKSKGESKKNAQPKKLHPRSHENTIAPATTDQKDGGKGITVDIEDDVHLLCKDHFFSNSCRFTYTSSNSSSYTKHSKRSSTHRECTFCHYDKKRKEKTLHDVLIEEIKDAERVETTELILKLSSNAAASEFAKLVGTVPNDVEQLGTNAVTMIYHLEIDLVKAYQVQNSHDTPLVQILSEALSAEACPIGSIVYAAFSNYLIFDRYMGGLIVDEKQFQQKGSEVDEQNTSTMSAELKELKVSVNADFRLLPVIVLEHIITFLDDEASGILPMVCMSWYADIGKTSPGLWQSLLARRKWPTPSDFKYNNEIQSDIAGLTNETRDLFISHIIMKNTIQRLIVGLSALKVGRDECVQREKLLAIQSFNESKETFGNIMNIQCWDDRSMMTANQECILSLFKAIRNDEIDVSSECKQIASVRVSPFPHSKRNRCELLSFNVDETFILCSYSVNRSDSVITDSWLTVVKKDDFLLNSADSVIDDSVLKKYDLLQIFTSYCENITGESGLSSVFSYLSLHRDVETVHISTSIVGDIVSCTEGNFVFIVAVIDCEALDEGGDGVILGSTITQFSAIKEALTFCYRVSIPRDLKTIHLSNYCSAAKTIVCTCGLNESIITLHGDRRKGIVNASVNSGKVCSMLSPSNDEGWMAHPKILSINNDKNVVFAITLENAENKSKKIRLVFQPRGSDDCSDESEIMSGLVSIMSLQAIGDYAVMLCGDTDEIDNMQEGPDEYLYFRNRFYISVLHVPSRAEICRCPCVERKQFQGDVYCDLSNVKLAFSSDEAPMIFASNRREGVLMTGQMLRDIEPETQQEKPKSATKSKIKKKQKTFKNNKKDGFARGMSLRG